MVADDLCHSLVYRHITPISASTFTGDFLCVRVSLHGLLIRTPVTGFRASPDPVRPLSTSDICKDLMSRSGHIFEALGGHEVWRDTVHLFTVPLASMRRSIWHIVGAEQNVFRIACNDYWLPGCLATVPFN